jgi:hypothetical protein
MKKFILSVVFYCAAITAFSQKINGQWRGYFNSRGDIVLSGGSNTEYILEVELNGTKVSGFSYTYFDGRQYYVVCKLEGTYYPANQSLKVIETERVKGNTRPDFQDCFQIHYLTYKKDGKLEELDGRWVTRPNQPGNCGDGLTTLTRRTLDKSLSQLNKKNSQQSVTKKTTPKTNNSTAANTKKPAVNNSTAKSNNKPKASTTKIDKPATQTNPVIAKVEPMTKDPDSPVQAKIKKTEVVTAKPDINFEKRKAEVLKTIQIENETFKVDLYDNGEIDGDSISVFYNNKLIVSHKRLTDKALTLTLNTPDGDDINELTMYAENLGEISPNTALMVVTDGDKRYEVRISSDLKNSGTIRFVHKQKNSQ